jgi:transposase
VDIPRESKSKENVQMTQKKRRIFTEEQKAEAVRIVSQSGKPVHQVAQDLGLTASALRNWVKKAEIDQNPSATRELTSPEKKEIIALRRQLKQVEMERDFLKKVAAFFAKDSSSPTS